MLNTSISGPQNLSKWEHLYDIQLPEIVGEEVALLIEANVPEAQIHVEVGIGREGEPYAVRTLLRWAIMGPLNDNIRSQSDKANVNFLTYASEVLGLENFDSISSNRKEMSV